jgi:hypothetical protein
MAKTAIVQGNSRGNRNLGINSIRRMAAPGNPFKVTARMLMVPQAFS